MSRVGIFFGIILIILGGVAYALAAFSSWTALIPAFLGLALVACGALGFLSQLSSAIVGLIVAIAGIGGTFMNVLDLWALFAGTAERPLAIVTSTITFVLLIVYAVIAVRHLMTYARPTHRPIRKAV